MMNATLVIFGASGDLTTRKLIPALYRERQSLGPDFRVVGMARTPRSDDSWRQTLSQKIPPFVPEFDSTAWDAFSQQLFYHTGSLQSTEDLASLDLRIRQIEPSLSDQSARNRPRIYYLATQPSLYLDAIQRLAASGHFASAPNYRRLILEKPFGTDLESAQTLNRQLREHLLESQIFRIDHYLGKETVRNLHTLWFANEFFEPLRHRAHIVSVEITAMESTGVERRGAYYDHSGVLRDMFQNHLSQLLALTALDPPDSSDADAIRDAKVRLLESVRIPSVQDVHSSMVWGQYRGYRAESDVSPQSRTPTFAALRLWIDNGRWRGVPFYLRSGKNASCTTTQIVFRFRTPPIERTGSICPHGVCEGNRLVIQIQPAQGVHLEFLVRRPDTERHLRPATLNFRFADALPEAYQTLLLNAIQGDASLFIRSDETEIAWRIFDPFIEYQERYDRRVTPEYDVGTWGPTESTEWITRHDDAWYDCCPVL